MIGSSLHNASCRSRTGNCRNRRDCRWGRRIRGRCTCSAAYRLPASILNSCMTPVGTQSRCRTFDKRPCHRTAHRCRRCSPDRGCNRCEDRCRQERAHRFRLTSPCSFSNTTSICPGTACCSRRPRHSRRWDNRCHSCSCDLIPHPVPNPEPLRAGRPCRHRERLPRRPRKTFRRFPPLRLILLRHLPIRKRPPKHLPTRQMKMFRPLPPFRPLRPGGLPIRNALPILRMEPLHLERPKVPTRAREHRSPTGWS